MAQAVECIESKVGPRSSACVHTLPTPQGRQKRLPAQCYDMFHGAPAITPDRVCRCFSICKNVPCLLRSVPTLVYAGFVLVPDNLRNSVLRARSPDVFRRHVACPVAVVVVLGSSQRTRRSRADLTTTGSQVPGWQRLDAQAPASAERRVSVGEQRRLSAIDRTRPGQPTSRILCISSTGRA